MFQNSFRKSFLTLIAVSCGAFSVSHAADTPAEITCAIRDSGQSLNCFWAGKSDKKTMTPEDISSFIDESASYSYITVKSRKGMERTFHPDPNSVPFKKLGEIKKTGSISEISRAKLDLFAELEKKVIKLSDDLDAQALNADLVKYDSSLTNDKMKRELKDQSKELETLRGSREKLCTTTPAFEQLTKVNSNLQTVLSNILTAFQTPNTCMASFKVFKDRDGTVDLRQLDGVGKTFSENCKRN